MIALRIKMDLDVLDLESLRCGGDEYDELVEDETPTPTSDPCPIPSHNFREKRPWNSRT